MAQILNWIHALSVARPPALTAFEQTRMSWAKRIESYTDVPAAYKDFFEPFQAAGRAFPYAILTPSFEGFIHRTTEKLICDVGDEIYVLERSGNTFEARGYPLAQIGYVEVRTMLLDSCITISGITKDGILATSSLRFNTVTDYLLTPIVKRIRLATTDAPGKALNSELEKFDQWVHVNYKFMSYAKRSLLGGEKVVHTLLQPEIRARVLTILGKTYYRMISPTHMCILTDRELIIISEEMRKSGDDRYGGIWRYILLHKIAALSVQKKDDDLLVLAIQLPHGVQYEHLFQPSMRQELDQFVVKYRELTL